MIKKMTVHFLPMIAIGLFVSCSKQQSQQTPAPAPQPQAEINECVTTTSYSSSAILSGTATFSKRTLIVSESGGTVTRLLLGNPISTQLPIRYAEVRVLDASGNTVQCGKTNTSGNYTAMDGSSSLNLPSSAGTYVVYVYARSNQAMVGGGGKPSFVFYASVKNEIMANTVYSISKSISSSGSGAIDASMNATALESTSPAIEGGAFNIHNSLLSAYEFLSSTSNTGLSDLTCLNPKLQIFWKAGFNPAQYIYPTSDPNDLGTLSFYLKGDNQLFINGGRVGNVSTQDTDHFDDAVIIHELGHHIEYSCGTMDSPGGSHSGQFRIDPRLAWSEGWGNFFGAHVIRNKIANINPELAAALPASGWLHYYDSQGYGATGFEYIRINLSRLGNSTTESLFTDSGTTSVNYDAVNPVAYPGEGHFREVSVARGLFKGSNTCTNCLNTNYFSNYWSAFEKMSSGIGMGKSIYPFRSFIKFADRLRAAQGGTLAAGLTTLFTTDEALQPLGHANYASSGNTIWVPYGIKLVPSGSACPIRIEPRRNNFASNLDTDQRYSNHFFWIDKTAIPNVTSISLSASSISGSTVDIDAIIFNENYVFNQDYIQNSSGAITDYSKTTSEFTNIQSRSSGNSESLSLSGLTSGSNYILNIRAYSSTPNTIISTTDYSYTITDQSGGNLCPSSSF